MTKQHWPTGIRPWGGGIQIRLWKHGEEVYSETLNGDPHNKQDLTAAVNRRTYLKSRMNLGLAMHNADGNAVTRLFRDVAQDYLNSLEADYSTHLSYEGIVNKYWLPAFGNWLIQEVKVRHIRKELAKYPNLSTKTKKNIVVPLSGIFVQAMYDEWIHSNPTVAL